MTNTVLYRSLFAKAEFIHMPCTMKLCNGDGPVHTHTHPHIHTPHTHTHTHHPHTHKHTTHPPTHTHTHTHHPHTHTHTNTPHTHTTPTHTHTHTHPRTLAGQRCNTVQSLYCRGVTASTACQDPSNPAT